MRHSGARGGDGGGEHVLDVVAAADGDFAGLHQQLAEEHQLIAAQGRAGLDFLAAAEPLHDGGGARCVGDADGIVGIEHGEIAGVLGLEEPALGGGVVLEGVVTVQVILRDVEGERDVGAKIADRLQSGSWRARARSSHRRASLPTMAVTGVPMLPPTCTMTPASRRMWPIRLVVVVFPLEPVMPMVRPLRNGAASSTSPITRHTAPARVFQRRQVGGDVGREHDQVAVFEDFGRLLRERDAEFGDAGEVRERLEVGGAHDGALTGEELRRSHTGLLHADDECSRAL